MSELPNFSFPILLFDGLCNLCHSTVQFVLRHEKADNALRFGSLESELGQQILRHYEVDPAEPDSVILIENGQVYRASSAALRLLGYMRFPWPLLRVFLLVPPFIRNAVYHWIGRNRYRWFGKKAECPMPKPEWRERFL